jgi:phage terminase small subunit
MAAARKSKRSPRKKAAQKKAATRRQDLNARQKAFVREYLLDNNGTQAAIRAGYAPKTAHVQASQLLRNPKLVAALSVARRRREERTEIKADRVLQELANIGLADIRDLFTWGRFGSPVFVPSDQLTLEQAAAISSVKCTTNAWEDEKGRTHERHVVELKLWDKVAALREMGKHLGVGEHVHHHMHDELSNMTDDELRLHVQGLLKRRQSKAGGGDDAYQH